MKKRHEKTAKKRYPDIVMVYWMGLDGDTCVMVELVCLKTVLVGCFVVFYCYHESTTFLPTYL